MHNLSIFDTSSGIVKKDNFLPQFLAENIKDIFTAEFLNNSGLTSLPMPIYLGIFSSVAVEYFALLTPDLSHLNFLIHRM